MVFWYTFLDQLVSFRDVAKGKWRMEYFGPGFLDLGTCDTINQS